MSLFKKLFQGAQQTKWDYPDNQFELLLPNSNRYLPDFDNPIPPALLQFNGTDMTEFYVTEYLEPRAKLFGQLAENNPELKSVAQDYSHPIRVLAEGLASELTDGIKKDVNELNPCSPDNEAKAHASFVILFIDGYTVAMVEKEISGLPKSGKGGWVIKHACKDFLISIAYRNWIGDAGSDIGILLNRPLERFEELSPPPFGPPPPDNAWSFFRYLVDYGFYCGSSYLEKGRDRFEKDWASPLKSIREKHQ